MDMHEMNPQDKPGRVGQMLLAAAMSLPLVQPAQADTPPERGVISFKYLDYQDWQPGQDRISVTAPAFSLVAPIGEAWSFEAGVVRDAVSGASPAFHTSPLGFQRMDDVRWAENAGVTRYFERGSVTAGLSHSKESDYESYALSLQGRLNSEDKNTTLNLGLGLTHDEIDPSNGIVVDESKNIREVMLGVTQVLSPTDIAQLNLTHGRGSGYYDDPYKFLDNRPNQKRQTAVLAHWKHHFQDIEGTAHLSYRYYWDSYKVRSHTLGVEYSQPLGDGWTLTPLFRVYSQSAAYFYLDPDPNDPLSPVIPPDFIFGQTLLSEDQRMAAYGARSFGFKVSKRLGDDWLLDFKYEDYQQRTGWRLFGEGSPGLEPLKARIIQVGISRYF